jgi:hypothetical protein
MAMTDHDTVARFRSIVAAGTLRSQRRVPPRVQSWIWTLCAARPAERVLQALRPHLFLKADDADAALAFLRSSDPVVHAEAFAWLRSRKTKPGNRGPR